MPCFLGRDVVVKSDGSIWFSDPFHAPDGKMIGRISLPERCANLCFGGAKRNRLFMAASQSIYSLYVETQGAAGGNRGVEAQSDGIGNCAR